MGPPGSFSAKKGSYRLDCSRTPRNAIFCHICLPACPASLAILGDCLREERLLSCFQREIFGVFGQKWRFGASYVAVECAPRGATRPQTVPIRGDLSRGQDDRRCAPYWIGHSPTCCRSAEKCRSGHPRPVTRLWEGPPLGFRILAVRFWGKVGSHDSQRGV